MCVVCCMQVTELDLGNLEVENETSETAVAGVGAICAADMLREADAPKLQVSSCYCVTSLCCTFSCPCCSFAFVFWVQSRLFRLASPSSVSSVPCVFCALANSQPSSTNNLLSCLWSCVCIHTYTHVHTHTHTYTHTASCHFWMVSPPSQHPEPADVPHTLGRIKCAGHRRFQPLPCLAELAS